MALVKCPDCGRSVSDLAPTCPGCGRPLIEQETVTIEQTGKRYKGLMVMFFIMAVAGFFLVGVNAGLGFVFMATGVLMFLFTLIAAWWNHG